MERRSDERLDTRFEVVWVAGSLEGEGSLRNLSRSGAWIGDVGVPPAMGAKVRAVILDMEEEEQEPVLLEGVVVRTADEGFALEFHLARRCDIASLLKRIAKADPPDSSG